MRRQLATSLLVLTCVVGLAPSVALAKSPSAETNRGQCTSSSPTPSSKGGRSTVAQDRTFCAPIMGNTEALLGPNGDVRCSGLEPTAGDNTSQQFGDVTFVVSNGTVKTTVRVDGAAPNTTFDFRLIQGNATDTAADCFLSDFVFTTDANGDATFTATETLLPGTTRVVAFAIDENFAMSLRTDFVTIG